MPHTRYIILGDSAITFLIDMKHTRHTYRMRPTQGIHDKRGADTPTSRDLHYAIQSKKVARFRLQHETEVSKTPKIMITALEVAEKAHLQSRNRVKREKALRGPVPTVYCGAGEELVGCLR